MSSFEPLSSGFMGYIDETRAPTAVAEWRGPGAGLAVLEDFDPPTWLSGSYQWAAVLADLHRRCGNTETAERYRDVAVKSAPTAAVRELLQRRPWTGTAP